MSQPEPDGRIDFSDAIAEWMRTTPRTRERPSTTRSELVERLIAEDNTTLTQGGNPQPS